MIPFFIQTLASQQAAGTLFNTYTTAKSVINPTELVTLPPNYLRIGSKLRIKAWGGLSNTAAAATVTFQVMMGSVVAWTSSAVQMSTTTNTLTPFDFEVTLRLDTAGSGTSAKFIGGGRLGGLSVQLGAGAANPTVTDSILFLPAGAPADGTGFDSTVSEILDFWVGFGTSSASNGIQLYDYTVEQLAGAG